MRKGNGSSSGSKGILKNRSASPARGGSSWGGNSRRSSGSRYSLSKTKSWDARPWSGADSGGQTPGGWRAEEDRELSAGSGLGEGLGQVLGEGLAHGLADGMGRAEGSAAFWRGVAVCALLVAVVVLVLSLGA